MKIKAGQIYEIPYLGGKVVVTWVSDDKTNFYYVRQDGFFFKGNAEHQCNFIAEYPTWQEAANKYGVCHESIRVAVHNGKASCGLHFALIKVGGK